METPRVLSGQPFPTPRTTVAATGPQHCLLISGVLGSARVSLPRLPGCSATKADICLTCLPSQGPQASFSGLQCFENLVFCLFLYCFGQEGRSGPPAPSQHVLSADVHRVSWSRVPPHAPSLSSLTAPQPWAAPFPLIYCCKHFSAQDEGDLELRVHTSELEDFPGSLVAKTLHSQGSSEALGSTPGQGTGFHMPQLRVSMLQLKTLHSETKTWHSQINKYFLVEDIYIYICKPEQLTLGMKKEQGLILGGQARQSGGREEYRRNSSPGDTHLLWFSYAFYSTGVGAESVSLRISDQCP